MAAGDAAVAAGYTVAPGTTDANQIDELIAAVQDDLAGKTGSKGQPIPVALGGTGAATAADARTALGAVAASEAAAPGSSEANKLVRYDATGRIVTPLPTAPNHAAAKLYVDNAIAGIDLSDYVAKTGNHTMAGNLVVNGNVFVPNSSAAVSGYTNAYINGDGRVSRGASSERFKHDIDREPELPDVFAVPIASFVMNADPSETPRYGPIAEDLAANPATAPFVVYDEDGLPFSFDQTSYLMAAVAALHATVVAQAARIAELEAER